MLAGRLVRRGVVDSRPVLSSVAVSLRGRLMTHIVHVQMHLKYYLGALPSGKSVLLSSLSASSEL